MQPILNYETEIHKAFGKIREDMDRHKAVFKRLEDELATVKTFESADFKEALDAMRRRDSDLYAVILDAYNREQIDGNADQHCQGVIAAVNAIYNLGYGNGFKQGAEYARKEKAE